MGGTDIPQHVGSTQLSATSYAETRKELLRLVQNLRANGAQAVVDVPRVVVIGNQSAGKSSVVEAMSGINVPRDAGTCTRCPMELRMTSSTGPWSCQISIRWEYDEDNNKMKVKEDRFGDQITDKVDVELALRRAQFLVLNRDIDPQTVLGMSVDSLKAGVGNSLAFSRNIVCVDLEGPDLTDLSFIDLPGLIQVAEEPHLVKLVEDLVVDHIQGNSLILVTVPMPDDLENQKALTLANTADPEGKRTIGVLTKADVVAKGSKSRNLWLEVIEGRRRPLLHGYYCTRQPDDDERERGISPTEARQAEAAYFDQNAPWSTSTHKHRFGIKNLAATLSPLLEKVIKDSLPNIYEKATEYLRACEAELARLPKAVTGEPASFMLNLVTSLCSDFGELAQGGPGSEGLVQESRLVFNKFKHEIRATTPNYVPSRKDESELWFENRLDEEEEDQTSAASVPFFLDDMRAHIMGSITRELPNNVPFSAKVTLIKAFQEKWDDAATRCFSSVVAETEQALLTCAKIKFGRWDHLHSMIRACINDLIKKHADTCESFIKASLEVEHAPFTQNTHYLQSCKEKWLSKYRDAHGLGGLLNTALSQLAALGYTGLNSEDLGRLIKPDQYETEMEVMAEVRGYFQVAYKRVIDYVPSFIDLKFIKAYVA
ncbi:P-loop containing nucleoside triphosphate hydrolase protein [Artomyces pyxidatus]|uniref:P-loop containing nucleoside triphosphate hydrolase protein n=1 Tax=Artomyces pyxidatus TaxID=48021 RepID=A0ACB8TD03_9AGAM|nr:P-loop containing nucleoside triphosphate hydrolase protein [Artomyces pyxidatus]